MYIIIISGSKPNVLVEMGIKHSSQMIDKEGDPDFLV